MARWVIKFLVITFFMMCLSMQAGAVDYELPDTDGQIHSLDQYKGKWLIVNYWATWCGACMKELPELIDFHKSNNFDAVVVGINFETIDREKLKKFVSFKDIPYIVLNSDPVKKTPLGNVPALPTTYIINPQGKVVAGEVGIVTGENLATYISLKEGQN